MISATIVIAALLGSASIALAGRKCITCGSNAQTETCGEDDISKYMSLDVQAQRRLGISVKGSYLCLMP